MLVTHHFAVGRFIAAEISRRRYEVITLENVMSVYSKKFAAAALALTLAMSLSACSNWSHRDRNTAIGAGAGALGGAILTDGSTLGTLGGAAVGGIIGHQVGK
jgi:osmotically inducible lipoprotein OsmB